MLIQELKNLIDSELIEHENFGEVPPRVEYELKLVRHKILPIITELRNFATKYKNQQS